jgi:hypothetical protein
MANRFLFALVLISAFFEGRTEVDTLRVTSQMELYPLIDHLEFYIDGSSRLDLKTISGRFESGKGFKVDGVPNFSGTEGTIWFRFTIDNQIGDSIYLSISNIHIEEFACFSYSRDANFETKRVGNLHPSKYSAIDGKEYAVPVCSAREGVATVYGFVRADAKPPLQMPMQVGGLKAHYRSERLSEFISIAALGVLVVMLFYNFCLLIVIKDKLYLFYCLYLVTSILCVLMFTGFLVEWFWPVKPPFTFTTLVMGLFYLGQLIFVNVLLNVRANIPSLFPFSFGLYVTAILLCF